MSKAGAQQTIKRIATIKGIGLHTGSKAALRLIPAEPNTGIVFIGKNRERIRANSDSVSLTNRSTSLSAANGASFMTVEHLLSALKGLGIDNIEVNLNGKEMPAMDGSAVIFTKAIKSAGIAKQNSSSRISWRLKKSRTFKFGSSIYKASPSKRFQVSVTIDFENTNIGKQKASLLSLKNYARSIAPARTFCLAEEIALLKQANLAKGGSLDNAIVVDESRILAKDGLRFRNEFARHKLLDFLGDIALFGQGNILAKIEAYRPSHKNNILFTKKLRRCLTKVK
ncbi:UDP-3-O-acyl-N-acetylglucosamine deacetylase [Elusimicrobiota bacterium]